jgi:hypothetical protein
MNWKSVKEYFLQSELSDKEGVKFRVEAALATVLDR